jgi:hypothetical protein
MNGVKAFSPTAALIVLGVVLASAIGQTGRDPGGGAGSPDPIVRELQRTVREHAIRIEQLEAREARQDPGFLDVSIVEESVAEPAAPGRAPRPEPRAAPDRIMILDSIESVEVNESRSDEVERLDRDIESLQRTVDQMERQTTSMSGRSSGGYRRYKSTTQQRKRAAQGELLADYRSQLRQKQGELKRLERELTEPKQLVYGHWQGTLYTLETTRDLSRTLDRISRGDTLTWDGRRLRADASSAEWIVTRLEAVQPPSAR